MFSRARLLAVMIAFAPFGSGCMMFVAMAMHGRHPPTMVAVDQKLPEPRPDKALVVFVWPPCESYDAEDTSSEALFMCRQGMMNRIRVVEHGARLVTDIDLTQYGASFEEPGRHRYAAYHWADSCRYDRYDCIAAMEADLDAGKTYFVTFRWRMLSRGRKTTYGRLELVPVADDGREGFRRLLSGLERVEPDPTYRENGMPGQLRSVQVSSLLLKRIEQDDKDGSRTPMLD